MEKTDYRTATKPTVPMFWHQQDLTNLLERLKSRPMLLLGGRGLGKTTLLTEVVQALAKESVRSLLVNGRETEQARETIKQTHEPQQFVFIDDLDLICTANDEDTESTLRGLRDALWRLRLNQTKHESSHYLATACIDPAGPSLRRLAESVQNPTLGVVSVTLYSDLTQNLESHRLKPWPPDWKQKWQEMFDSQFRHLLRDKVLRRAWSSTILSLTGGHPALFGPAIRQLTTLCNTSQADKTFDVSLVDPAEKKDPVELEREIRLYVEDFLSLRAMRPITSSVRRLSVSKLPNEIRAFESLLEIARQNTEGSRPPSDFHVRRILIDDGLVYRDNISGKFVIPGSMIRGQIINAGISLKTLITALPDPENSNDAGEIAAKFGSRDLRITLSGALWRVFFALYSGKGEIIPQEKLQELAVSDSDMTEKAVAKDKAVRNAVQRLNQKLKETDMSRFVSIRNEYSKGYRLILTL